MKLLRKQHYIYTMKYKGKTYTFVTSRTLPEQKIWFDKVYGGQSRYEDIDYKKIPQSRYDSSYLTHVFI